MNFIADIPSLAMSGLGIAAVLFIISSGLSIIFGVSRVYNLSHGSLYMLGAYLTYSVVARLPAGPGWFLVGVVVAALTVALVGVVIEVLIMRRIYSAPHHLQIIATFGVFLLIRDITSSVWGSTQLLTDPVPEFSSPVTILGQTFPAYYLVMLAASLIIVASLTFLLRKTRWGVLLRAAIEDRDMVSALGVNQSLLFTSVFALSAALAGLAGGLDMLRVSASLDMDINLLIDAFAVVVIGGMGSILGTLVAALIVGFLSAVGIAYFNELSMALVFITMAIILLVKPQGLFGKEIRESVETAPDEIVLTPATQGERHFWLAALVVLVVAPFVLPPYWLTTVNEITIYVFLAWTFYLLAGIGGMVSLGHAAFLGLGMYAPAILYTFFGVTMVPSLFIAPLGAGLLAILIGSAAVRLTGIYFGMLTLAFGQILWAIAYQWIDVTNGEIGIIGIWPDDWAADPKIFFLLTLVISASGVFCMRRLVFSPFGYALRATRDSVQRSDAIGINIHVQRWIAYSISGAMAGMAGVLLLYLKGGAFPSDLDLTTSLDVFIMALLGGLQSMNGPIIGAVIYQLLKSVLQTQFLHWHMFLGILLIGLALFMPHGISGVVTDIRNKWARKALSSQSGTGFGAAEARKRGQ
ncbi:ABC transporter permease [Rhizobium lusitanum]|uniref:ABC transporter permease n=1 Tax=Rhizobium lusitanum TaxID=293958 RepID=UPI001572EA08|nr:ABC transporter permease [Rhizobium lusitanum]NTJ11571.1 ABC transporter permease [Rhizobium lusitanum]